SAKYGGAINAYGPLQVSDSSFEYNHAAKYIPQLGDIGGGGAIYAYGDATITGSSFIDNSAVRSGGAVLARHGATISGSSFDGNAAGMGGAVFAGDPDAVQQVNDGGVRGLGELPVVLSIADSTFTSHYTYGEDSTFSNMPSI